MCSQYPYHWVEGGVLRGGWAVLGEVRAAAELEPSTLSGPPSQMRGAFPHLGGISHDWQDASVSSSSLMVSRWGILSYRLSHYLITRFVCVWTLNQRDGIAFTSGSASTYFWLRGVCGGAGKPSYMSHLLWRGLGLWASRPPWLLHSKEVESRSLAGCHSSIGLFPTAASSSRTPYFLAAPISNRRAMAFEKSMQIRRPERSPWFCSSLAVWPWASHFLHP